MENKEPSEEDLKTIRTRIIPKLEEIRKELEVDPEVLEEMVRKSRELSTLSNEDMFHGLKGLANYHCKAEKHCDSCPFLCTLIVAKPRLGRVHHPEMPMPMPSLIRKAPVSEIELEVMRDLWRNVKW